MELHYKLVIHYHNGQPEDNRRVICVGGGTGIAPFIAFAKHFHDTNDKEVVVLHGASYVDELSYKRLFTDLEIESEKRGRDKWNFRYRAAISRPKEFARPVQQILEWSCR